MGFVRVSASHEEVESFDHWGSYSDERSRSVAASVCQGGGQWKEN